MKKIFCILVFLFFAVVPAFADTMVVQALADISTTQPDKIVRVKVMRDCFLDGVSLKIGYILEGNIYVKGPKRLKRDATFNFCPTNYIDLEGNVTTFSNECIGKFSPKFELDVKGLAESAVASVADHFIKGISSGFYAVQGAVQNKNGNPFKSAVVNVYEHSIFSYANKGEALLIIKETMFGLKFDECENCPMLEE